MVPDMVPAQQSRKRKRRPKSKALHLVATGRGQWNNPIRLGGWVVSLRLRGLSPDVTVATLEHLLVGVAAKCRIKVDADKVGADNRVRANCAEINFPNP